MSKKYKKIKKREATMLKASNIESYIRLKFNVDDNGFWNWFFNKCDIGDYNVLSLHTDDHDKIDSKYIEYFSIIKDDFINDSDENEELYIVNDL